MKGCGRPLVTGADGRRTPLFGRRRVVMSRVRQIEGKHKADREKKHVHQQRQDGRPGEPLRFRIGPQQGIEDGVMTVTPTAMAIC